MEFTESELDLALKEGFTCYLAFLSHTQRIHQSQFPRRGKAPQTASDLSTEHHYQCRIAAVEACLRYTGRISRRVIRWSSDSHEDDTVANEDASYPSLDFGNFMPDEDDCPFLDPLSGTWVSSKQSAGPSGNDRNSRSKHRISRGSQSADKVRTKDIDTDEIRNANIRIDTSPDTSPDTTRSTIDTPNTTFTNYTLLTPSSSKDEVSELERSAWDDSSSEEEDDESLEDPIATEPVAQTTPNPPSRPPRPASLNPSFYQLPNHSINDEAYARLLQSTDRDLLRDKMYAQRLYAKEKAEQARIERDRVAALKAEQEIKWELEALARETEAMRAEERQRREEEEERKRVAEKERKFRIEREKRLAAEIEEKRRLIREENEKKDAEAKKQREKEARRQERKAKAECTSCMEDGYKRDMAILPCSHIYCRVCIYHAVKSACKSHTLFTCCRRPVPPPLLMRYLSTSTFNNYELLNLELTTPNPLYCSSPTCSRFIPPSRIQGGIGTCTNTSSKCNKTRTCAACKKEEHKGICREDKDGKKVKELAKREGWKECRNCGVLVERKGGCLHITCRCRAEWCFACGRDWELCNSTCGRE